MYKIFKVSSAILFFVSSLQELTAQSLPVGTSVLEDYFRREQLLGKVDSTISFSRRPISRPDLRGMDDLYKDSILRDNNLLKFSPNINFAKEKGEFILLPLSWQQQYNTNRPYGWNDGAMVPARGYEMMFSGGFYAKYGPLSIQLRPEFVWAQNKDFKGFYDIQDKSIQDIYFRYQEVFTDIPERFGSKTYDKTSWGQSSIRLTFDPVSIGISNENLWWGPGIHNSLLMSDNAAGFKHITLNTSKPVKTFIGSFEGQIIAGKLENSDYPASSKRNEWRYLSGYVFSYQPKWVPGFFIGITRAFQMYHDDVHGFGDYMPLFIAFEKKNTNEALIERDQLTSVFFRWVWQEAKAEIYGEYGRNDHAKDSRDLLMQPFHTGAYLVGLRKIIPLNESDKGYLMASMEYTKMSQSGNRILRDGNSWYIHGQIHQGYTNDGQVLGAGTGPGSNLLNMELSWFKELKKIGLAFDSYEHNNDFYTHTLPLNTGKIGRWTDYAVSLNGTTDYRNLIFNASLQGVRSVNYEWLPGERQFNLKFSLGIMYRFN